MSGWLRRTLVVPAAAVLACAAAVATAGAQAPDLGVRAIPEFAAVRSSTPFRVAVRLDVPAGWHIYWINPGAGGMASTLSWKLPEGIRGGTTAWPYPETEGAGAEGSNVYRGTVVLFSSFASAPHLAGPVRLAADLVVGMCRVQCVRVERTVAVELPLRHRPGEEPTAEWNAVALAERAVPVEVNDRRVRAGASGDSVRLVISGLPLAPAAGTWVTWFPLEPGQTSVVAEARVADTGVMISLPRAVLSGPPPGRLTGVLVGAHPPGVPPAQRPFEVDVPVAP